MVRSIPLTLRAPLNHLEAKPAPITLAVAGTGDGNGSGDLFGYGN